MAEENSQLIARSRGLAAGAGLLVAGIGVLVLAGWLLGIEALKTVVPGALNMKFNTALAFALCGPAILLILRPPGRRPYGALLAALVALLGLLSLAEYVFGRNLGIDEWLVREPNPGGLIPFPGRMAPNTAGALLLAGLGILLIRPGRRPFLLAGQILALLSGAIAFAAIVGHLFGVSRWYGSFGQLTGMSPHTALAFVALSVGMLLARPTGLMEIFASPGAGGEMARRMLPAALLIPLAIGIVVVEGEQAGAYHRELALPVYTVLTVGLFALLLTRVSVSLERADGARRRAEMELRQAHAGLRQAAEQLEARVQERTQELAAANTALSLQTATLAEQAKLLNMTHDAIVVRDLEARIRFWNQGAADRYGWTAAEVIGKRSHELLQTRFPTPEQDVYDELIRRGRWDGELVHTARDGREIAVLSRWALLPGQDGRPPEVMEINSDITERKQAEAQREALHAELQRLYAELEQQAHVLDQVLSASPDHFYMYDRDGRYLYVNGPAAGTLGFTQGEMVGKTWRDLGLAAEVAGIIDDSRKEVVATGLPIAGETPYPLADETRYYDYILSPIRGRDGQVESVVATVRDITERKRAENEVRKLNDELRRAAAELEERVTERTSSLQDALTQLAASNKELEAFSYSVSHDLRAPLRAIDGFSRILMEEYAETLAPDAHEYLQLVRDNTQQMGRLIDDLLAFSRMGRAAVQKRPVDLCELAEQAYSDLAPEREGREVQFRIGDLPTVKADPGLLKQVFVNLLANALKFTRSRSVAVIEVGCEKRDGARDGPASGTPAKPEPVIFVRDNGVGFDMQYASKLFGVFQRLHRAEEYEGTGVGLALVQRIIHRHGGRVWAEGAVDAGATFYFTLGGDERG